MTDLPSKPADAAPPEPDAGILRIVDAAANRAGEALRVVEDYVRFVLDDAHLTRRFKQLRHDLAAALASVEPSDRAAARQSQRDVGASISTPLELAREDADDVLAANLARLAQALRSLEEYAKTLDAALAVRLEPLRYQAYTLGGAIQITRRSRRRLADVRLYVLIDGRSTETDFTELVEQIAASGADAIQLRDKRLSDRELLGRARLARRITARHGRLLIINDRPDIAVVVGADGVHVGQDDATVKDARRVVGPRNLVGVSTHSMEQARSAVLDGADYLGVGPTFPSATKSFVEYPGPRFLAQVADEIALPAFAIGGIGPENIVQTLRSGIRRVAVSRSIVGADDPVEIIRACLALLD